jgi:hypothetical protein
MSKSVNLQNGGLPHIKEIQQSEMKPPLLTSVAFTKQNGNNEKKFITFLQTIDRNKNQNPGQ